MNFRRAIEAAVGIREAPEIGKEETGALRIHNVAEMAGAMACDGVALREAQMLILGATVRESIMR